MLYRIKKAFGEKENKTIFSNISLSIVFKLISLVFSIINTKLYISFFNNNDILGVWYTIVSVLNWILYFDLGIGNGLRNEIVEPLEKKDDAQVKRVLSTGYVVISLIAFGITIVLSICAFFINWNAFLNISSSQVSREQLFFVSLINIVGVGMHFILKTITSFFHAMRKTSVSGFLALLLNVSVFFYLMFVPSNKSSNQLLSFSLFYHSAIIVPYLILTIYVFGFKFKRYRPSVRFFDKHIVSKITKLGIAFFVVQVALLIVSSTDSWIISFFFEPSNTVDYQIYYRMFSIALTVFSLFSQTIWSSITKYYTEKNSVRIMNLYKLLNLVALLGGFACFVLAFLYKFVVRLWMSNAYDSDKIELFISLLFATWMTLQMIINSSTAIANGIGKLKIQTIFIPVGGVIKIVGVIVLSSLGFGWSVIVFLNIISLVPLAIAQFIDNRKSINSLKEFAENVCRE